MLIEMMMKTVQAGKYVECILQECSQLPKTTPIMYKDYLQKRGLRIDLKFI